MPCRAELFKDRRDAGRVLARAIRDASQESDMARDWQDGIVLGLPRGGVPVA
jgi:predicted phosphoribosyltransferase